MSLFEFLLITICIDIGNYYSLRVEKNKISKSAINQNKNKMRRDKKKGLARKSDSEPRETKQIKLDDDN